jgi:uroporphyrinogen-III synthase
VARISSPPEGADRPEGTPCVLLTRPLAESRAVADLLAEDRIDCLIWPLTRVVPVATTLTLPAGVDGVIATSAHGIRAFAALCPRRDLPVLAVAQRTAEVARGLGFGAVLSAQGDAVALTALAAATGLRHLVHPRGRETTGDLPTALAAHGLRVSEAVLYAAEETGPPPPAVVHALARGGIGVVTVWSTRNATLLAGHLVRGVTMRGAPTLVAISRQAGQPLASAGFGDSLIAERPDQRAMLAAIRTAARAVR